MAKTKGFKTGKKNKEEVGIVEIRFAEGHDLYGLEIDVQRRVPVGVLIGAQSGDLGAALAPLVKRIVRWNLQDDQDSDLPVSLESFGAQFDSTETSAILAGWVEAVATPLAE